MSIAKIENKVSMQTTYLFKLIDLILLPYCIYSNGKRIIDQGITSPGTSRITLNGLTLNNIGSEIYTNKNIFLKEILVLFI